MRTLQSIIALSAGGWILSASIAAAQEPQNPQPPGMRAPVRQAVTAAVDPTYRTAWAIRVTVPPSLDGYPEDSAWARALPITDFVQRRPDEGKPPTEETEVRIVYDDEAIYFLFICFDSEPEKVRARLTPRDYIQSSDNVHLWIDSFNDRRTAFEFVVNAENVQEDVLWTEDTRRDESWNGIWSSAVRKLGYGWVAEIEIPFSCLRFSPHEFSTWGLNLARSIERKREYDQWRMVSESERGFFVSRFGMLGGLEGIESPLRLELLPYATGQLQDNQTLRNDFTRHLGLDVKYGINSGTTLDLAINPEFGTVETDEEQLNLTPFPTYYPEKRPFFLEFQDIFRTDIRLVHTRRIGKPLGNAVNPSATILTGARLVGKTAAGLHYGLIEAAVDQENYYWLDRDGDGELDSGVETPYRHLDDVPLEDRPLAREQYLEPRSNYFVGRLLKEFEDGSSIGVIGTNVLRETSRPEFENNTYAYTGGLDWDYRVNQTWSFNGQVAGSAVRDEGGSTSEGYGLELKFHKFNGEHLTYGVDYDRFSDQFDVNDLGWVYGNDYGTHRLRSEVQFRGRPLTNGVRSYSFQGEYTRNWTDEVLSELYGKTFGNRYHIAFGNYDGGSLSNSMGSLSGSVQFMNYWNAYFGAWQAFDNSEDAFRAAQDYDFIFKYPRGHGLWFGLANDYSSPLNVSVNNELGTFRDGDQWSGSVSFRLRPRPNLEINFGPRIDRKKRFSEFSTIVDTGAADTPDQALTLRNTSFESLVLRTSYTLNNKLDFRLFAQYTDFGSRRYQPIADPGWLIDTPYQARSTFGLHFVTRFEYRPGSYFYLVYKENRYDESGGGFSRPDRQIIGKFTYWLSKG